MRRITFRLLMSCAVVVGLCALIVIQPGCAPSVIPTDPDEPGENPPGDPVPTDDPASANGNGGGTGGDVLDVETEGEGRVVQESDGDLVTLTAIPSDGWRFDGWFGSEDSAENPLTVTITDETSLGARFTQIVPGPGGVTDDADEDLVPDDDDLCPDTPVGAAVDEDGCADSQRDSDDDKVTDDIDLCPDTPRDTVVDAAGCPVSADPDDIDGDSVPNDDDACPSTLAGADVDKDGCADSQLDSDGDDVTDDIDQCPDTPEDTPVHENGCPIDASDEDGDGVPDDADDCPDTPLDEDPDSAGCSCSQLDGDGDQVNDCDDQCPDTDPAQIANVNAAGCVSARPPGGGGGGGGGGGNARCGDGTIDAGEECDPPDGITCDDNCLLIGDGSCFANNDTAGCDDETCEQAVCAVDPYCCDTKWDEECVGQAVSLCPFDLPNDPCDNPLSVGDGTTEFDNLGAMSDGGPSPGECGQVLVDVWFCYTASCTGFATVSLCRSGFDTMMVVYDGCECPTAGSIGCSDDDCGFGLGSRLSFEVQAGEDYMIRVGGYDAERGEGVMNIICGDDPDNVADSCGAGAGDCLAGNGTPGCADADCCEEICLQDPYCCDVEWDNQCAAAAGGVCAGDFATCGAGNGDCDTANASPGCDDGDCCQTVCAYDAWCCLMDWDGLCVDAAAGLCGEGGFDTCGAGAGDCSTENGSPGCDDEDCCQTVCANDPYCCLTEWDGPCVDAAAQCP